MYNIGTFIYIYIYIYIPIYIIYIYIYIYNTYIIYNILEGMELIGHLNTDVQPQIC